MRKLLIVIMILIFAGCSTSKPANTSLPDDNGKDPQYLLNQGLAYVKKRMPEKAIRDFLNPLVQQCLPQIKVRENKVYCAINKQETMYYLLNAAKNNERAIVLKPDCAYAFYFLGYAYLELGRKDLALMYIGKAVELSPGNPQFLSELGYIYQGMRQWQKALEIYETSEKMAELTREEDKSFQIGRALRGQGYSLIEMGKLDEAEKLYLRCLEINKNDKNALKELIYIKRLRG